MTTIFCNNSSDQLEETLGIFGAFQALHVSYTRASSSTYNSRLQGFIWSWKLLLLVFWIYDTVLQFHSKSYGQHDFISQKDKSIVSEILQPR